MSEFHLPEKFGQRLWRFPGGIRMRHFKQMSCHDHIETLPLLADYHVPVQQQMGPEAQLLVNQGEQVLGGTPIARAAGPLGVAVHAPTSGTVVAIDDVSVANPSGYPVTGIHIKADGKDRHQPRTPLENWREETPEALRQQLADMGVVGMGGATFPTHHKLRVPVEQPPVLLLNGVECEPYISCDEMLMRQHPKSIICGCHILAHILGTRRCVIGIEDTMGGVRQTLLKAIATVGNADGLDLDIEVVKVPTIYPEGGERQLIQVLTGLEVPEHGLPLDLGIVVQNVATAASVTDAIENGKPSIERLVTVTGPAIRTPQNVRARIGTPFSTLIEAAGGFATQAARVVMGGPMMGIAVADTNAVVTKGCNCVLALPADATADAQRTEMPCIRCGECANVCPAKLLPQQLLWEIRAGNYEAAEADFHLDACIECGCCAVACPSHIPLVDYYRHAKAEVRHLAEEQQKAREAKERYERRNARIEAQQRAREERLKRRKQRLQKETPESENMAKATPQSVADAIARAKAKKRNPDP